MTAVRAYFHTHTHLRTSVYPRPFGLTSEWGDDLSYMGCTCMPCIPFQVSQLARLLQNIHLVGTTVLTLAENKYSMLNDKNKGVQ